MRGQRHATPRPGFRKASGIEWNLKGEERQGVNETKAGWEQAPSREERASAGV